MLLPGTACVEEIASSSTEPRLNFNGEGPTTFTEGCKALSEQASSGGTDVRVATWGIALSATRNVGRTPCSTA